MKSIKSVFSPRPQACVPSFATGLYGHATLLALVTALVLNSASAMAQPPEAIRNYNQGIEAYSQGQSTEALKRFTRATQLDPNYADAWYNMGSIHYQMKQYDQARSMFQRAVTLNPRDSQAKYNLGLTLEKIGRYEEAVGVLSQIPSGDPKASQARAKIDEMQPALKPQTVQKPSPAHPAAANRPANGKSAPQTFSKGYDGPTGITIGPGGFMYVANYSKNLIYRVGANGDKSVFCQGDNIKGPIGLVFNPRSNELYVANYLLNSIVRISETGKATVLASGLTKPYNLYLDTVNSVLYVSEQDPANIISRITLP